jgi:myo-inositol-1(or 4)-monophosphatase
MVGSAGRSRLQSILGEAGRRACTRSITSVVEKASLDYVTNIDHELDEWLTEKLCAFAPETVVYSEERRIESFDTSARCWLIDPLDGTHNLKAGLPFNAISAAYFEGGEVVLAGVCDIVADDIYVAERGGGSWRNDRRLRVPAGHSGLMALSSGTLDSFMGWPSGYRRLRKFAKLRNFGAQALHMCYVARGALALVASQEARLWDDAAGRLIAEEAGGKYTSFRGFHLAAGNFGTPMESICAHPDFFELAFDVFGRMWGGANGVKAKDNVSPKDYRHDSSASGFSAARKEKLT